MQTPFCPIFSFVSFRFIQCHDPREVFFEIVISYRCEWQT